MTASSQEPVALADALIAAYAGHSLRGKLLLPTRMPNDLSEGEAIRQACVVASAGCATFAGLPVVAASQDLIGTFSTEGVAAWLANLEEFDVLALRMAEVPTMGGQLALLPHRQAGFEVPFFVKGQSLILAVRKNEWIYKQKRDQPSPVLDSETIQFVRFLFTFSINPTGAIRFIERPEDVAWLPDAPEQMKREFREKFKLLRRTGTSADGRAELSGTAIVNDIMANYTMLVSSFWRLELVSAHELMNDLAIEFGPKVDLLISH